jgi:hypothetical protein
MERILSLVAIGTLIAGVAFAGYQYKEQHIPAFMELQAKVEYQACIQQCLDTCRANAVPVDRCNCNHCNVYKVH